MKNEREVAFLIIEQWLTLNKSLQDLLSKESNLTPFSQEICFGVCRHYFRLERIIQYLTKRKTRDLTLFSLLLIGLYELRYMKSAPYAVVKEIVNLVPSKKSWAKGFINATLRNACRKNNQIAQALKKDLLFKYGHPRWLLEMIQKAWPKKWQIILEQNDLHPPLSLRVNEQKITREAYKLLLHNEGIVACEIPHTFSGLIIAPPIPVQKLPHFNDGYVSVQDGSPQLCPQLMDLKPGLSLLDACAAPGGKTTHILETIPGINVLALDIDALRLKRIEENLKRLGLKASVKQGDALIPTSWWNNQLFDRILLDTPCSATGVIRRHPDIKRLRTKEAIANVNKLQLKLLETLWPLLTPTGLLLYATCSILPCENEEIIAKFLLKNPNAKEVTLNKPWGEPKTHGLQILPGQFNMDGFYYCLLEKSA